MLTALVQNGEAKRVMAPTELNCLIVSLSKLLEFRRYRGLVTVECIEPHLRLPPSKRHPAYKQQGEIKAASATALETSIGFFNFLLSGSMRAAVLTVSPIAE